VAVSEVRGQDPDGRPGTERLSQRARRVGAAYAGPGSGADVPAGEDPPIGFVAGLPDPAVLPAGELTAAFAKVLATDTDPALQYGGAQGHPALREWLAVHWAAIDGAPGSAARFTLTNGAAGALANIADTFLDPGDVVVVEEFSFSGSVRTLLQATPRIETVPVDRDGLDPDALADLLDRLAAAGTPAKMLYTIPAYQNPTGATLAADRRRTVLDLCARHGTLIVEDEAYREVWFGTEPPPSLYAMAGGAGVIRIGTFSKILAPGLRLGWCQAADDVTGALVATRTDMGTSPLVQRAVARLARTGFLDAHIPRLRGHYAAKSAHVVRGLAAHCAPYATWQEPGGGFFAWLTLAAGTDPLALAEAAREEGVTYVSGNVFAAGGDAGATSFRRWGPGDSPHLRLAFSHVPDDEISEGVRRLGAALARAAGQR
jgi:2-aminoadipate transaminase